MNELLLLTAEAVDTMTLEQVLELIQQFDYEALMSAVEKLIGAIIGIVIAISGAILFIKARFEKAKLALTSENFQEKANAEKAEAIALETKSLIADMSKAFKTVAVENKETTLNLRDELNVAKELLHVAIKSGTVDADGLIELGQIAERAKGSVVTITDGINDVLQIATEKLDNQGSILDKPTEG
jgi:hypothetical protein